MGIGEGVFLGLCLGASGTALGLLLVGRVRDKLLEKREWVKEVNSYSFNIRHLERNIGYLETKVRRIEEGLREKEESNGKL